MLEARALYWEITTQFNVKIYLIWIPSHKGLIGNEIADILAKQGAFERADDNIHVPFQDLTSVFKEEEWNDTQDRILIQARFKGQHYFSNYYKRSRKKSWFHKIQADRYFCTLINRIRANHYNLNASLARKGYIASAQCDCGHDYEDIDHVVWTCDRYNSQRELLREKFVAQELDRCDDEQISSIIKREDWNKLFSIYQFIRRTKRII